MASDARPNLRSSTRSSKLPRPIDEVSTAVASGEQRFQRYVDAVPFVRRGAVDRLLGGTRLVQTVTLRPDGLLGLVRLVADLRA